MDIQRKCGITASDIDAMTSEELLELAKAQGQYVGRRLPTEEKGGVYARVLDAPRFLRRLIQVHPKQFTKTLAKLYNPDSVMAGRGPAGGAGSGGEAGGVHRPFVGHIPG